MTTFDDKEKAAENKYARDQELEFRIMVRAHKLFGVWAAGKLGLSGEQAEAYAKELATADFGKSSDDKVFRKVKMDLAAKKIVLGDHDIREQMYKAAQQAKEQITG